MHRPDTPGCYTASAPDVLAILHAAPGHTPGRQYRRHIHQEPLMNRNTAYLAASAVAAALAIGALSGAAQAQSKTEKCFGVRSEEHTSALQSLMRTSYAVFCLKKKNKKSNVQ